MRQKFKITFLFTLFLFAILITLNIATDINPKRNGWYSAAIMYFFSFSFLHISILQQAFSKGVRFVRSHLFLTGLKMLLSIMFIIIYGLIEGEQVEEGFFFWFLALYLLYTSLLGWLFYRKK